MCYNMLFQEFENKNKIIDISVLPSCKTNRELYIERAHYVAVIRRQPYYLNLMLDDPRNHGTDGNLVWSNNCYPEDITDFVLIKMKKTLIIQFSNQAVTLKTRLKTILILTVTCTNNPFGGELAKWFDSVSSEQ